MHRSTYVLGLIVIGFFAVKVLRFQTLGYTFNDMYAFLQMSRSWIDDRPFMYENIWGYHHRIHNYYTVLLWGPLCRAFGAYGLFAVQSILLAVGFGVANERLIRRTTPNWARYMLLIIILLGPVSFWLNDHPNIGWHTELTYLPLGLLFSLALLSRNTWATMAAGMAIVLVKEDGAVLAALIHLSYRGMRYVRKHPKRPLYTWLSQQQFWLVAVGWVIVFLTGMVWLGIKNNFAEPRLQLALALLETNINDADFWRLMLKQTGESLLLLLPVAGLLCVFVWQQRESLATSLFIIWSIGIVTLTLLNFVQSVHYYEQPLFYLVALTWPPRFVLVWAFSAAFLTLVAGIYARQFRPLSGRWARLTSVGLLVVQVPILYLARPDFPSPRDWVHTLKGRYASDKDTTLLQADDLAIVQCLADKLPHHANVFAFDYLVPFFHRQYGIWPTGKHYKPADIALIPIHDKQGLALRLPMQKPYRIIRLRAYNLYVSAGYEQVARSCLP
ncbi:hypothetical protein [Spirosoma utsteinense]|uniref:Glycosyltransferase RgtA/B/C/D-like domain-containing protein n=1 Tax=Spirosoma utsteinense TaxID=2585773 RepID=A0ABR6W5A3_9BACT|nr:hypothetical protein [Spirosoma utsteinense]MBC3786355.1 hypothetical protein [Spirosoma utsteinense]MBC3791404.1 hypothetical protein [Spirosoma utsteinense]